MFKITRRLGVLLLGVPLISVCLFKSATVRAEGTSTWNQVAAKWECPEWFKDAKFGLWLHWGPQTIPAKGGGWYARSMYMELKPEAWGKEAWSYHRETYGHQSKFGYKDICNLWKADKFDAEATVTRFQDWGAHYVAMIANHHDNFDLYPSSVHDWNTTKVGPKRDLIGEFSAAARGHNLKWVATVHAARAAKHYFGASLWFGFRRAAERSPV